MRHARDTGPVHEQPVHDVVLEFEAWIETLRRAECRSAGDPSDAPAREPATPED